MRFISRFQKFALQTHEPQRALVNGLMMEQTNPVHAKFNHGGLMDWEIETALAHWGDKGFKGLPEGVVPQTRLAVFDSEIAQQQLGWDEGLREQVEQRLLKHAGNGPDYIVIERPQLAAPWAKYDEQDAETIDQILEATGIDPDYCRRYEHENKRRLEVFELLEDRGAAPTSLDVDEFVEA